MGTLKTALAVLLAAALAAPLAARPLPEGARYVAMGSSYAAGPGVGDKVEDGPARCGRGTLSYSRVLAARLKLDLVDASCSGAVTAHVLGPWNELPAQLDALPADTRLVTITIGGNDVRFVTNLGAGACAVQKAAGLTPPYCPAFAPPTEAEWAALAGNMTQIAREIRRRAPRAQVVFVDYVTIAPPTGTCMALGVAEDNAAQARAVAARLAALTARVARANGARILAASRLTRDHSACAADPWSLGARMKPGGVPMHPAIPAHAAIAGALETMLRR